MNMMAQGAQGMGANQANTQVGINQGVLNQGLSAGLQMPGEVNKLPESNHM
jgi:hypothetical protein